MGRLCQKGILFSDFRFIRWLLNPDVFWILGSVFRFSGCALNSGKCFWNLGHVLDSGKCFWNLVRVWILGSVLSLRATVDLHV